VAPGAQEHAKAGVAENAAYNQGMEEPLRLALSLEPLDDRLIVEPVDEDVETRTGLIIPQSAEAGCRSGIVTAVGADANGIDPGDKVLFPKEAGFDVRLGGVAVKVLRRSDLIARVHD
jgi:chaperonin GroES